ncbi:DUF4287 domain-containing protein [Flavobacteriaceae bacterium TK19130]|nr:DUF4287 domain-containing protein [Thermobacterium salinum]
MEKAVQKMIDNMPEKTGKSLIEWKALLKTKSFTKHAEAVNFLKKEHSVTHGFANTIISLSKEEQTTQKDLIANQYKGKENLLPIYESLVSIVKGLGNEAKITPKKTEVSLNRKRKFAVIKPATKSRIDLGLKLKGKSITERLENSGPFGTMCTHRVRLTDINQIDSELIEWLKEAYSKAE